MDDLDKKRYDFLQTLRSFDSKLKPDIILINESTLWWINYRHYPRTMEARMTYWHETKTKKYHDLSNRIAEKGFTVRFFAFEIGYRGLVGKSLRKFLTALELPKKIIEETLTDCAITALKCSSLAVHHSISNHRVMGPTLSWNVDKRHLPNKHRLFSLWNRCIQKFVTQWFHHSRYYQSPSSSSPGATSPPVLDPVLHHLRHSPGSNPGGSVLVN